MSFAKLACAALVLLVTTSCTTRDTETANAAASPQCRQSGDHPLEKVGRTIFWLEIKLMEQTSKTPAECDAKPE